MSLRKADPADRSNDLPKAILSWSSGKDGAMALYRVRQQGLFNVVALLTTITEGVNRISMHGVHESLVERQALALSLPLYKVYLPFPCPNSVYEERVGNAFTHWKNQGVTHIIFGDIFLEDIRRYREEKLSKGKLTAVFPLWHADTKTLAEEMIGVGFEAVLTCVDSKRVNPSLAGASFNQSLIRQLPGSVDPCGENGEFHTFVYKGPVFESPLRVTTGDRISRQGFEFVDLHLD